MTFGQKLQSLRKGKGWSQEELAARMIISRQAVSKWELDESIPDTENIIQLSKIFQVTTDFLLREENAGEEDRAMIPQKDDPAFQSPGRSRLRISGILACVFGVLMIGTLVTLSQIIPARMETKQTVPAGEIIVQNADGSVEKSDQEVEHTSYISIKAFVPFLNTYSLHWLFALGFFLLLFGISTLLVQYDKDRRHKRKALEMS